MAVGQTCCGGLTVEIREPLDVYEALDAIHTRVLDNIRAGKVRKSILKALEDAMDAVVHAVP